MPNQDRKGKGRAPSVASTPTPSTPVDTSQFRMPVGPVPAPVPPSNQFTPVNFASGSSSTLPLDPFVEDGSALRYHQNLPPLPNPAADAAQLARAERSGTGTKRRVISSLTPAGLAADAASVPSSSRRVSAERAQKVQRIETGDDEEDFQEEIEQFKAQLRAKKAEELRVEAERRAEEARLEEEERQRRAAEEAAAAEKLAKEKAAAEKVAAEKLAAEKAAAEELAATRAAEEKAAKEQAAREKAVAEAAAVSAEDGVEGVSAVGGSVAGEGGPAPVGDSEGEHEDESVAERFRRHFPRSPAPGNELFVAGNPVAKEKTAAGGAVAGNETSPARNTRSQARGRKQAPVAEAGPSRRQPIRGNSPGKIVRRASSSSRLTEHSTPREDRVEHASSPYRAEDEQEALALFERNEALEYINRLGHMDREARALVRDAIRRNYAEAERVIQDDERNKADRARIDERLALTLRERNEMLGRAQDLGMNMNVVGSLLGPVPGVAKVFRAGEKIPLTKESRQNAFAQWSAQTYEPLIERKCFECAERLTVYGSAALECKASGGPEWRCVPCVKQKSGCHPNVIDASLRPLINQIIIRQREYYALNDAQRKGNAGQAIKTALAKPLNLLKGKLKQIEPLVAHANMGSYHPNVQADVALRLRRETLQLQADANAMTSIKVSSSPS